MVDKVGRELHKLKFSLNLDYILDSWILRLIVAKINKRKHKSCKILRLKHKIKIYLKKNENKNTFISDAYANRFFFSILKKCLLTLLQIKDWAFLIK